NHGMQSGGNANQVVRPSPARRPSAGPMPGRCECCSVADTHRPLFSRWAEPTDCPALTAEAIIVARGRMVVGDDGQGVKEERAEVVAAATHAEPVRPAVAAVASVVGDFRSADGHGAGRRNVDAAEAVSAVAPVVAVAAAKIIWLVRTG